MVWIEHTNTAGTLLGIILLCSVLPNALTSAPPPLLVLTHQRPRTPTSMPPLSTFIHVAASLLPLDLQWRERKTRTPSASSISVVSTVREKLDLSLSGLPRRASTSKLSSDGRVRAHSHTTKDNLFAFGDCRHRGSASDKHRAAKNVYFSPRPAPSSLS